MSDVKYQEPFFWPLIDTAIGKALRDYQLAVVEECTKKSEAAHRKTLERFEELNAEIMKLMAATDLPKPVWFEPELERLGVVCAATEL